MSAVTRFAPSPTGSLHVGGARTALYCLLHARHAGGRFILRIEDTDQARSSDESMRGILRDMEWLGLDWDEGPGRDGGHGPYRQSQRLPLYNDVIQRLIDAGHAYEAWESREELTAFRAAARAAKQDFHYRRRPVSDEDVARYRAEGRVPVIRMAAPPHDVTVTDRILGEVTLEEHALDDVVIREADCFPTHHLAVVVNPHHMGVTQVLRGQEHLMNTHKHLGLMEALGWDAPAFGHMPIIFNPGGSKMSKRDKAKAARASARLARDTGGHTGWGWLAEQTGLDEGELTRFMKKKHDDIHMAEAIAAALGVQLPMIEVMDFRRGGYLPEALNNYLALLGWSPGDDREILSMDELVEAFTLERVNKTAARFDLEKLRWMNGEYLRSVSDQRLRLRLGQWLEVADTALAGLDEGRRWTLVQLYRARVSSLSEIEEQGWFFLRRPTSWDAKAAKKHLLKGGGLDNLAAARAVLADAPWEIEALEASLGALADARGLRMGKVAQPVRVAVAGQAASPGIGDTLAFLGRDEVLARVDACLGHFRELSP